MKYTAKKLVTGAICAAIGIVCITLTRFVPLTSFVLLMLLPVCLYIAFSRSGHVVGFLTAAVILTAGFFICGVSGTLMLSAVIFVPYGILAFYLKRFAYSKPLYIVLRLLVVVVYANLTLLAVYGIAKLIEIELITRALELLKYYAAVAAVFSVMLAGYDFLFCMLCPQVLRRLK